MKPKIIYQLAADSVINDASANKISVVGIFQNINLLERSDVFLYFAIVSRIEDLDFSENKREFKTEIYDPDGEKFSEVTMRASNDSNKVNLIARFPLQEFSKKGDYRVKVFIDGKEIGSINDGLIFQVK